MSRLAAPRCLDERHYSCIAAVTGVAVAASGGTQAPCRHSCWHYWPVAIAAIVRFDATFAFATATMLSTGRSH